MQEDNKNDIDDTKNDQPEPEVPTVPISETTDSSESANSTQANEATASTPDPSSTMEPVTKPRKPLSMMLVIVGIIVLIGVVVGGALLLNNLVKPDDTNNNNSTNSSKSDLKNLSGKEKLDALVAEINPKLSGNVTIDSEPQAPTYHVGNNRYYVDADKDAPAAGLSSINDSQNKVEADNNITVEFLTDNGFTKDPLTGVEPATSFEISYYYDNDTVCMLSYDQDVRNDGSYHLGISCAPLSAYVGPSNLIKPFADAFFKAPGRSYPMMFDLWSHGSPIDNIVSNYTGYKVTGVEMYPFLGTVGGFYGQFYQTPDQQWHFFRASQDVASCNEYNTDDLKKAYLGVECYGGEASTSSSDGLSKVTL